MGLEDGEDVADGGPEVTFVVLSAHFSSHTEGLTRKSANDSVHAATPRERVEGSDVRPDRSLIQPAFRHCFDQCCGGIRFPLHQTDWASSSATDSSEACIDAEVEPSDAGAEAEGALGT